MTNTYNTGNPIGSTDARDLYDNTSNFDDAVNGTATTWLDRLGVTRKTFNGLEQEIEDFLQAAGFAYIGEYAAGLTFTSRSQYMVRSGIAYRLSTATPIPYTTTGVWATDQPKFIAFEVDTTLAADLANSVDTAKGASLVGYGGSTVRVALQSHGDALAAIGNNSDPSKGADLVGYAGGSVYDALVAHGAAISGLNSLPAEVDQLQAQVSNSAALYFKEKVLEVSFRDATYDTLLATYGYAFLYPQSFAIDTAQNELWVLRGGSGGSNSWAWIWVYDLTTGARKTTFTTGQTWRESLVIRYEGTNRYIYTIGNSSSVIRLLVNTLPTNLSTAAVADTYAVNASSFLAYDGTNWYVQDDSTSQGTTVRHRFTIWRQNFLTKCGELVLPIDAMGTVQAYMDYLPKSQGICFHQGSLYSATGGAYDPAGGPNAQLGLYQQGILSFTPQGVMERCALNRPEPFITAMTALIGYPATLCETEGVYSAGGNLYSLQITLGQTDRVLPGNAGKWIVLVKELSTSPTRTGFLAAARGTPAAFNALDFQTRVHTSTTQIVNPITGVAISTFADIVTMMRELSLSAYRFSGVNQTLTDLNAASVPTGQRMFECFNTNGNTFIIRVTAATPGDSFWYVLNTNGTMQVGPYFGAAEYGSNANGEYIKHANGVLDCWYTDTAAQGTTLVIAGTAVANSLYQSGANIVWIFPTPFIAAPECDFKMKVNTTNAQLAWATERPGGTVGVSVALRVSSPYNTASDVGQWRARAIGRWK